VGMEHLDGLQLVPPWSSHPHGVLTEGGFGPQQEVLPRQQDNTFFISVHTPHAGLHSRCPLRPMHAPTLQLDGTA